jgi:hypothetical protein
MVGCLKVEHTFLKIVLIIVIAVIIVNVVTIGTILKIILIVVIISCRLVRNANARQGRNVKKDHRQSQARLQNSIQHWMAALHRTHILVCSLFSLCANIWIF